MPHQPFEGSAELVSVRPHAGPKQRVGGQRGRVSVTPTRRRVAIPRMRRRRAAGQPARQDEGLAFRKPLISQQPPLGERSTLERWQRSSYQPAAWPSFR